MHAVFQSELQNDLYFCYTGAKECTALHCGEYIWLWSRAWMESGQAVQVPEPE